jgi:hypothetical protein
MATSDADAPPAMLSVAPLLKYPVENSGPFRMAAHFLHAAGFLLPSSRNRSSDFTHGLIDV